MPPVEMGVCVQAHAGAEPQSKGPRFPCKNFVLKCNSHAETCGVKEQLGKFSQTEPPRSQHPGAPLVFVSIHYPALSALTPNFQEPRPALLVQGGPLCPPGAILMRSGPVIQRVEARTLPTPYSAQRGPHCRGPQVSSEAEAPRQVGFAENPHLPVWPSVFRATSPGRPLPCFPL